MLKCVHAYSDIDTIYHLDYDYMNVPHQLYICYAF